MANLRVTVPVGDQPNVGKLAKLGEQLSQLLLCHGQVQTFKNKMYCYGFGFVCVNNRDIIFIHLVKIFNPCMCSLENL